MAKRYMMWILLIFMTVWLSCIPVFADIPNFHPYAYVANTWSHNVSVIDLETDNVVATIPVGRWPNSIVMNRDGTRVYVGNDGSRDVTIIDTVTNRVIQSIPLNDVVRGVLLSPIGDRLYVAHQGEGGLSEASISIINTDTKSIVENIPIAIGAFTQYFAIQPDGSVLYVINVEKDKNQNNISVIETDTVNDVYTLSSTMLKAGSEPYRATISSDGKKLYVSNSVSNDITVFDTGSNSVVATIPVDIVPFDIILHVNGSKAYAANYISNTVSVIDTNLNTLIKNISGVGPGPMGLGIYASGQKLYVTNYGSQETKDSNTVSVINLYTDSVFNNPIHVGLGPAAICIGYVPVSNLLFGISKNTAMNIGILLGIFLTGLILRHVYQHFRLRKMMEESAIALSQKETDLLKEKEARHFVEKEMQFISEREQSRFSQDLRDNVIQQLTGVKTIGDTILQDMDKQSGVDSQYLQKLNELLMKSIHQLHRLSNGLYPVDLHKNGLHSALQNLAGTVQNSYSIKCIFKYNSLISIEDNMISINLFRIVQEALNNAIHHSQASLIEIESMKEKMVYTLTIKDNGIGFNADEAVLSGAEGMGLKIMKYRADIIGADLSIISESGNGTIVQCTFDSAKQ